LHLFYIKNIDSNTITLNEEESKHCIRVLRLKKGSTIFITNGTGDLYETVIVNDNPKKCIIEAVSVKREFEKRDYHLHLAVAPTKNISRFEWFLEKATEIGIDQITPVICKHSERKTVNTGRLNRVITSAVKQSLKAYHPLLNEPIQFDTFIKQNNSVSKYIAFIDNSIKLTLKNIYQKGDDALILIGPEGDFNRDELQNAIKQKYTPISLGKNRLRTETAAIASCLTINLLNE